jgi:hypothetical protein
VPPIGWRHPSWAVDNYGTGLGSDRKKYPAPRPSRFDTTSSRPRSHKSARGDARLSLTPWVEGCTPLLEDGVRRADAELSEEATVKSIRRLTGWAWGTWVCRHSSAECQGSRQSLTSSAIKRPLLQHACRPRTPWPTDGGGQGTDITSGAETVRPCSKCAGHRDAQVSGAAACHCRMKGASVNRRLRGMNVGNGKGRLHHAR